LAAHYDGVILRGEMEVMTKGVGIQWNEEREKGSVGKVYDRTKEENERKFELFKKEMNMWAVEMVKCLWGGCGLEGGQYFLFNRFHLVLIKSIFDRTSYFRPLCRYIYKKYPTNSNSNSFTEPEKQCLKGRRRFDVYEDQYHRLGSVDTDLDRDSIPSPYYSSLILFIYIKRYHPDGPIAISIPIFIPHKNIPFRHWPSPSPGTSPFPNAS